MSTNLAPRRAIQLAALSVALAIASPIPAALAVDEHYIANGAAIEGYDAVAYHVDGKPTKGSPEFTAEYQGATWHFASAENRDQFKADPAKFAPAYGGWCSAGASKGKKVATKPAEFWEIVDGRLYLNSSQAAHEKLFLADPEGVIRKGEMNWKVIYATPASDL